MASVSVETLQLTIWMAGVAMRSPPIPSTSRKTEWLDSPRRGTATKIPEMATPIANNGNTVGIRPRLRPCAVAVGRSGLLIGFL
jgi:hypothetical protein